MEDSKIIELYWQRNESAINITEDKYGSFLTRIAFNVLMDAEDCKECVPCNNILEEKMDEQLLAELIGNYLRKASDSARRCFVRKYFHMDSIKEIADFYNMSESKVKILLHRTRKGLKEFLKKEGYEI